MYISVYHKQNFDNIFYIWRDRRKMVHKIIIHDIDFYMGDSMQTDHNETGRYLSFFFPREKFNAFTCSLTMVLLY